MPMQSGGSILLNDIRACGRPVNTRGSCAAILYLTGLTYSRVCGRVIGYNFGTPNAFGQHGDPHIINFDGMNITREAQHDHIWSYVAGYSPSDCPCSTDSAASPPQYIGDCYYCESGNANDPLWNGQHCEGTCCNDTMTPPWFSVQLPAPSTDMIEVSICADEGTHNEDVTVELMCNNYLCVLTTCHNITRDS